jgi:cytochrome P450
MDFAAPGLLSTITASPFRSAFAVFVLYRLCLIVYRLFFHPLSKIPGPKLTAATGLVEGYYNVVLPGMYFRAIQQMHDQYGPIVRVRPNEIHIRDTAFYNTIYNQDPKFQKASYAIDDGPLLWTADSAAHKAKRRPYAPYFSRQSIVALEDLIHESVGRLCSDLSLALRSHSEADVSLLYRAFLADNICEYMFGRSLGLQSNLDLARDFIKSHRVGFRIIYLFFEVPGFIWAIERLIQILPASAPMKLTFQFEDDVGEELQRLQRQKSSDRIAQDKTTRKTILHGLLESGNPIIHRNVSKDANSFFQAGYETTGHTLDVATVHVLSNPAIHAKLIQVLRERWPPSSKIRPAPSLVELEKIPYLQAVAKEALRMSLGVSRRLPRVNHDNAVQYGGYEIPPGWRISMNQSDILSDPEHFPDPYTFNPERWLRNGILHTDLDKYFVIFSRGSRDCIGRELAKAELIICLATIFRRFDLQLAPGITRRNVDMAHDFFVPLAAPVREPKEMHRGRDNGGGGVFVVVRKDLQSE